MITKTLLFLLLLFVSCTTFGQVNVFKLSCDTSITVIHYKHGNLSDLTFRWVFTSEVPLRDEFKIEMRENKRLSKASAAKLLSSTEGVAIDETQIEDLKSLTDTTKVSISYQKEYSKKNITDLHNQSLLESIHGELMLAYKKQPCGEDSFVIKFKEQLAESNKLLSIQNQLRNPDIISLKEIPVLNEKPVYKYDIRNPIAFTVIVARTPRANGKNTMRFISNYSSYDYIKPTSSIHILFNKEVYKLLNKAEIRIEAYIKRKDESIVPVSVSGYFDVSLSTNESDFVKGGSNNKSVQYTYNIQSQSLPPVQAEVITNTANPQIGDKLVITVKNASDANISFTTTLEFEDSGWTSHGSGGFSWVNSINTGSKEFLAAGTIGYNFTYKFGKGTRFWTDFFMPSFGPEIVVLQSATQNPQVGLGICVAEFLRTVKCGFGWNLVGNSGKPYVSVGVNFIEGIDAISGVLKRSSSNK